MNIRRILAILAVASLAATGVACSSDSKSESKKKDGGSSEQVKGDDNKGDTSTPPSTITDSEYADQMSQVASEVNAAGDDECKLLEAVQVNPPQPANEAQTKEFATVYVKLLNSIAGILGTDSANGKAVAQAAKDFESAVSAKKYSPEFFSSEELAKLMSSDAMTKAMSEFSDLSSKCPAAGGASSDGASSSEAGTTGADAPSSNGG